jgi:hypothetical protein
MWRSYGPVDHFSTRKMNLYRTAQESGKNARSVLPKTAKWAKPEKIAVKQGQSGAREVLFFSGFLTHLIAQFS